MKKAVFLDRDGTINVDRDFVYKVSDLRLLPNAAKALKMLQDKGFLLIIITNQSGIGRGLYKVEDYHNLMDEFDIRLRKKGINITKDYFCRHAPEENCDCRKPNIGMIQQAVKDFGIDLSQSYFIGDKTSDILAGKRAGIKTILVKTGKAGKDMGFDVKPDYVCNDIYKAVKSVIA